MQIVDGILEFFRRTPKRPVFPDPADPQMVFVTMSPVMHAGGPLTRRSPPVALLQDQLAAAIAGFGTVYVAAGGVEVMTTGVPEDKAATAGGGPAQGRAGGDEVTVYVTGADADRLFAAVQPVVRACPLFIRAWALIRYGGIGAREVQVSV